MNKRLRIHANRCCIRCMLHPIVLAKNKVTCTRRFVRLVFNGYFFTCITRTHKYGSVVTAYDTTVNGCLNIKQLS